MGQSNRVHGKEILSDSPYQQAELQPLGTYQKTGFRFGIRTQDGEIHLNFKDDTSYAYLMRFAELVKAEIVIVEGIWTFEPDVDSVRVFKGEGK